MNWSIALVFMTVVSGRRVQLKRPVVAGTDAAGLGGGPQLSRRTVPMQASSCEARRHVSQTLHLNEAWPTEETTSATFLHFGAFKGYRGVPTEWRFHLVFARVGLVWDQRQSRRGSGNPCLA